MSPTRYGLPTFEEAVPYPGAPRCFKREYMGLIIIGYSARSTYDDDQYGEDEVWRRRKAFPSVCYSRVEVDGEYGFTPMSEVTEITEQEFVETLESLSKPVVETRRIDDDDL